MVALVLLVATWAWPAAAGAAQADDPYGPTSTTPPSSFEPECDLSVTTGAPGTRVTATVTNVPPGGTVRILFDGSEVGRGTAPEAPATFRRAPIQTAATTLEIDFVVPDLGPGTYIVSAVGANFTLECSPDADGFGVLAGATGDTPGSGDDDGRLAFTGLNLLLLLLVALALILAGRYVLRMARQRREANSY